MNTLISITRKAKSIKFGMKLFLYYVYKTLNSKVNCHAQLLRKIDMLTTLLWILTAAYSIIKLLLKNRIICPYTRMEV